MDTVKKGLRMKDNTLIGALLGGLGGAGISYYLSLTTYKIMCQTCFCAGGDYACCTPSSFCECPEGMAVCPEPKICPYDGTPLQCINPWFGINPVLIIPPLVGIIIGAVIGYSIKKL